MESSLGGKLLEDWKLPRRRLRRKSLGKLQELLKRVRRQRCQSMCTRQRWHTTRDLWSLVKVLWTRQVRPGNHPATFLQQPAASTIRQVFHGKLRALRCLRVCQPASLKARQLDLDKQLALLLWLCLPDSCQLAATFTRWLARDKPSILSFLACQQLAVFLKARQGLSGTPAPQSLQLFQRAAPTCRRARRGLCDNP